MATARRKTTAQRSKGGSAKKAGAAKRPAAKSPKPKAVAARPAAARPKPAAKPIAKPVAKPAAKPVAAVAKPRPSGKLVAARPLPGGRLPVKPAPKPGTKSRPAPRQPAEVRPLGVLPPGSMARPRTPVAARVAPPPPRPRPELRAGAPTGKPMVRSDERLNEDDLQHFERRLLDERARIVREMGHLDSTVLKVNPRDSAGELSGYSFHMADAGTDSMEREISFDIASKEGRLLREIDDALRRIYNGTYGVCEVSGKPISRARLEALPWARYTVEEQEKLEREQRAGRVPPAGGE